MPKMVDISEKDPVKRRAKAKGFIELCSKSIKKINEEKVPKGNVLSVAKTAGVLAVKNTPNIVPLTHPIPIQGVNIGFDIEKNGISTSVEVKSYGQTGVEMEALSGVMATLTTIWDMIKKFEKDKTGNYPNTRIKDVRVVEKKKYES